MVRDIELALIKRHILYHADKEWVFGIGLINELAEHGYTIGPGTLYPVLNKIEKAGLLSSKKETVEHKQRKYYRLTGVGRGVLKDKKGKVDELYREIFME